MPTEEDNLTTILEAAKYCYLHYGIEKTGMQDIAKQAKLARSTVYRYYPSSDDLLLALISAEMQTMNGQLSKKLARFQSPEDIVVEGVLIAIKAIPQHPLLSQVFAGDNSSGLRQKIWNSPAIVALGTDLMATVMQHAVEREQLQQTVRSEILIEWVYRILLSFLSLPSNWIKTDKQLRETLHALLIPVLLKSGGKK
ncbi:MAG TPA: TetR/AcrR family transcriptional regulator [Spongiibacteraceae bacterium]|nr:TetR/AcrR family transcriptional regulator [Spongiibacteraceae bacterium]